MENEPKQPEEITKEKKASPLEISEETRAELTALFEGKEWKGEKLPPVFLKFFSGPHGSKKDAEGIKSFLEECDIYIPEGFGWGDENLEDFQNTSGGAKFPWGYGAHKKKIGEYLQGMQKKVAFVDIPETLVFDEKYTLKRPDFSELLEMDYNNAVQSFFEMTVANGESIMRNREKYMIDCFSDQVKQLVSKNPELKNKEALHVLMSLGSGHSAIFHEMKKLGGDHVSRDFNTALPIATSDEEIFRRNIFDKKIPEKTKERSFFEIMIRLVMERLFPEIQDTNKKQMFIRYLSSQFTSDEIKSLFEKWKENHSSLGPILGEALDQKNIEWPETEEELDAILEKTTFGKYQATLKEKEQQKNESSK